MTSIRPAGFAPRHDALRPRWCGGLPPAALTFLLLVCLSGCTGWRQYVANGFKVGPNYRRPAAPVAQGWIDADNPAVRSQPADDAVWWQTFHDPVLDSLVQAAYLQNLTLRAAGLRILEARAQRNIAAGELLPQLQEAFGSYARSGLSKNVSRGPAPRVSDEWSTGANLAWELDFWGRFRRAIEAADADLDASVEDYDDVLVLLLSEVAQSYLDLRTAEQRVQYAARNVVIQVGSLKLAELRYDNGRGIVTRLDVTQAQSNLSQTQATIPPLESARRRAANSLCILLGIPPGNLDETLYDPQVRQAMDEMWDALQKADIKQIQAIQGRKIQNVIPAAPPEVAVGIPADLLRRRPDVRRAERQVAAQSARIGIATSDLYPHFSIAGTIYVDANQFQNLFSGGSLAGNVGPFFRWDILNYGRLVNQIRFQEARFQELAVQYQNTVLQANQEAEDALVGFLKSQQQVAFVAQSTVASEQSLGLVHEQYAAGKTDFNRVLTVEQLLTQQQDQLAVAQGRAASSLIQLYKALGGGWQIRLAAPQPLPGPGAEQGGRPGPQARTPPPDARDGQAIPATGPATAPKEAKPLEAPPPPLMPKP
jgi:outer membrane protein TolC